MDNNKLPDCPALIKTPLDLQEVTLMLAQELAAQESLADCLLGIAATRSCAEELFPLLKQEETVHVTGRC